MKKADDIWVRVFYITLVIVMCFMGVCLQQMSKFYQDEWVRNNNRLERLEKTIVQCVNYNAYKNHKHNRGIGGIK